MLAIRLAFLFAFVLLPLAAQAQSFNCRYARTPDEVAICRSDRLSRLDEVMARLYFRLRNSLGGSERAALETEQAEWLQSRRECGADGACIADAYRRRIRELRAY